MAALKQVPTPYRQKEMELIEFNQSARKFPAQSECDFGANLYSPVKIIKLYLLSKNVIIIRMCVILNQTQLTFTGHISLQLSQ